MTDKNTYIIREYPDNKTKVSRSRVYDKQHFIIYLKEMETGEEVKFKSPNGIYKIKKIKEMNENEP
tara:strand:- start:132 stop:329 length:198 start_codon:yes stop_codon:yes gene_type:complete